jgi:uncharacterized repeat protein (TIGR01451 family)
MRKNFRSPVIVFCLLVFSILLLPNVEAAREGITSLAFESFSPSYGSASAGRLPVADFSLPPQQSADLSVSKVVDSELATAGTNLTYTITVQNGESFSVAGVKLDDTLPGNLEFVSLSYPNGWTCSTPQMGAGGPVSCTNQSLAANAVSVFTLVAKVPSDTETGTSYTNTATVSSPTPDTNDGNNSASAMTTIVEEGADLSVSKVVDSEEATPGANLTYTITVHSGASDVAENVTLSDPLPAGLEFVSLAKPDGWTCSTPAVGAGGTITCTISNLAAGSDDVFTLVVKVPTETAPGTAYTNVATVSSTTPDPNEENNRAAAASTVDIISADLRVTKTVDLERADPGKTVTYTITVRSGESDDAANVTLTDTLPDDSTFVSLDFPDGWTCTTPAPGAEGTITCTIPNLPAGSVDVFILVAQIPANAPAESTFTNTASVSTTTLDPNEENNTASATTTISSADLAVTKVDIPDPVAAGSDVTYTITLRNNGPDASSNVTLTDTMPVDTTFVSLTHPNGWTCTIPSVGANGPISCSAESLPVGNAIFTLIVKTSVSLSNGTILTNTASASSSKTYDSVPNNNTGMATTTILTLRAWTTAGDSGVTEDESNPARPTYTNFTASARSGSPAGTYVLRYNIQATDGLKGPGANTRLRVRFRDEGAGSRVTVAIRQSSLAGGVSTLGTVFDSNAFTQSTGFQTREITFPAVTFDFTQNTYWLEVTLSKDSSTNQPGFGAAQINRQ